MQTRDFFLGLSVYRNYPNDCSFQVLLVNLCFQGFWLCYCRWCISCWEVGINDIVWITDLLNPFQQTLDVRENKPWQCACFIFAILDEFKHVLKIGYHMMNVGSEMYNIKLCNQKMYGSCVLYVYEYWWYKEMCLMGIYSML